MNTTTFLKHPAHQLLGTQLVYAEQEVDFASEAVNVADTLDVLNIPKGAVLLQAGFYVKTTEAAVTLAMDLATAAVSLLGATAVGAVDTQEQAAITSGKIPGDDTVRVTIGGANATAAKIVFYAVYAVSDAGRN